MSPLRTLALAAVLFTAAFSACAEDTVGLSASGDAGVNASSGSSTSGGDTTGVGLPCDVDRVLATSCRSCHQSPPQFGAPMPLLSYEQLTAPSGSEPDQKVFEVARERMRDAHSPMPPPPNASVSDADLATFDAWIAAGTPRGDESCDAGTPEPTPDPTVDCVTDVNLRPPTKFAMPQDESDLYVCYGVDLTPTEARQVVAFTPRIDNHSILHHALLFQSDEAFSPTPTPCSSGGSVQWRVVYAWAPGGTALVLPPEAGMPLEGTTHYIVQLHYNNVQGLAGQLDGSGFDLCSTNELRPNEADVIAFGTDHFSLPPGSHRTYDCTYKLPAQVGSGVRFVAAMPHMHQLGASISTQVERAAGGDPVSIGAVDDWNFQTQYWQPFSVDVKAGDTVRTRCGWNNGTSATVGFGENTADEMCYSFSMYYPRIVGNPSWALPAFASACTFTDAD